MIKVDRPIADNKKITTKDSFELCYLRHQYFRRAKYNPTEAEMQPYMKIVDHLTRNTFFVYFNLFKSVGMYHDDVLNIGRVHLVSFLGLYALDKVKKKRKEWEVKFYIKHDEFPEEKDVDQKNKANFTMFFKQRMEDLVRVCRQKSRNIKGKPSEEYVVFYGKEAPPKQVYKLLKDYEELGYKKIDFPTFKSIRKKSNVNHDATIFKFGDTWYVAIALEQKNLDIDDIIGSGYNPYENFHNMQPDDIYIEREEEKETEQFHTIFNNRSNYRKRVTLRNFIAKNKKERKFREEIATAKKLLKSLGE